MIHASAPTRTGITHSYPASMGEDAARLAFQLAVMTAERKFLCYGEIVLVRKDQAALAA